MLLKNKLVKSLITKISLFSQKSERRIKRIEFIRGLYRYPHKMLGRILPPDNSIEKTDILVFAAHPDDDILGLGTTLYRHSLNNENIKVVFITNGTGRDGESWNIRLRESNKKSETRYREAVKALSLINIPRKNILCLGYPDGGTQRYIKNMLEDVLNLIQKMNPSRIYVHCIEGGHDDHDLTSTVVKSVCQGISYTNVFEWAEYNPEQPLGAPDVKFLRSTINKMKTTYIKISEEERQLKRQMLACHQSQDVEQFFPMGEAIRKAETSKVEKELFELSQISEIKLKPIVKELREAMQKCQIKNDLERIKAV